MYCNNIVCKTSNFENSFNKKGPQYAGPLTLCALLFIEEIMYV
jgi:hypothetical protein